jgi:hypothetical protein
VYQVIEDGRMFKRGSRGGWKEWDPRPHTVHHLAAAQDTVYQVIEDGRIFKRGSRGGWKEWDPRPHRVKALAADNGVVFQVHSDGALLSRKHSDEWKKHGKIKGIESLQAKYSQLFAVINNRFIVRLWYE